MTTDRTYGIEIECFANVGQIQLAQEITANFALQGINHSVTVVGRYRPTTDGANVSEWEIKPDGSLRATPTQSRQGYRGIEVVSPVLRGIDGLKALKVVTDALNRNNCKVNKTAGLHIHHGVNEREMRLVAANWFRNESVVMAGLPESRRRNKYCKRWHSMIRSQREVARIAHSKYVALNLSSYALRGTIEFRCAAGSVEYAKIANWAMFTQAFVERSINAEFAAGTAQELADWLAPQTAQPNFKAGSLKAQLRDFLATPRRWSEVKAHFGRQMSKEKVALNAAGLIEQDGDLFKSVPAGNAIYRQAAEWFVGRVQRFSPAMAAAA